MFPLPAEAQRLPTCRDEVAVVAALQQRIQGRIDWTALQAEAAPGRSRACASGAVLGAGIAAARVPISSSEGLALMRLAESLLRVPDTPTAVAPHGRPTGPCGF